MRITSARLNEAVRLSRAITSLAARARVERRGDLTLSQVAVLGRLSRCGPITPGEVADQLRMKPQTLTRILAALESGGLLRRTPDPEDGRATLLDLTDRGVVALQAELGPRDRWVAGAVAAVCTDDERRTLAQAALIMERLVEYGGGVALSEP